MKRVSLLCSLCLFLGVVSAAAQSPTDDSLKTATLYSSLAHKQRVSNMCFSFEKESLVLCGKSEWDLIYGNLRAGQEWDWFQVSTAKGARSKIVSLGKLNWSDSFKIPNIEPFPKLREGERRQISVNLSGADGKDGRPGPDGLDGTNADGSINRQLPTNRPQKNKSSTRQKLPYVDPIFIKAEVGKMYAIHVVDEDSDFYVLFRVESLERGDRCVISWKKVAAPDGKIYF
jgi:hypothetical protein